ncbi:Arm DNA-binding domain-containing protein [Novosphingobium sediminis]|uniref:Arm DNA-binding domain-containing protein n=1 Tax=Novosphingobium sediminis TaxID=707214 RepID=UPI0035317D56
MGHSAVGYVVGRSIPLKNTQILSAAPGMHGDGNGLYLNVTRKGAKSWIFRYQLNGKRCEVGLGCPSKLRSSAADSQPRADIMLFASHRAQRLQSGHVIVPPPPSYCVPVQSCRPRGYPPSPCSSRRRVKKPRQAYPRPARADRN